MYLSGGLKSLADADPVSHHDTLIAPVVAKDLGEQVVVAHREFAVDLVIRSHDGPGVAFPHGYLEAAEVDLAGSALRETLIDRGAVGLLGVHGEVLGRDACALTLHAIDIGGCNLTREQRILRVILEVSAAEGIAVEVHAWAEDHVATVFLGLVADGLTYLTDEFGVPRRGETRADGKGSGIIGLIGTLAGRVDAHTGRAVGEHGGRDAQSGDGR